MIKRQIVPIALAIAVLCVANGRSAEARPLPDTVLVDQRGAPFTLRDLRGKPAVLTFVATRCTDACPIANAVFAQIARRADDAQLVTVTLDPRYDTPFVMSRYARGLPAHVPHWRLASGPLAAVRTFLQAFGVVNVGTDVHSTLVYLIDARGRLARVLPLSAATAEDVHRWLATRS